MSCARLQDGPENVEIQCQLPPRFDAYYYVHLHVQCCELSVFVTGFWSCEFWLGLLFFFFALKSLWSFRSLRFCGFRRFWCLRLLMIVSICRVFVWYLFFYSFLLTLCLLHLRCSSYVFRVFVFELACIDAAVGFCLLHLSYALETSLASFIVVQVSLFLPFFKQLLKTDVHMCLRTCSNCDCNISLSGRQHYHQSVCHLFSILFSNWVCCWKSYLELWPRQRRLRNQWF